jgi:hypothetical protein
MDLTIGPTTYDLTTTELNGRFTAYAVRGDLRERFGVEASGASEAEALDKLSRWLQWQYEHTQALAALQQAERAYHRAMGDAAFAIARDLHAPDGSKASLEAVDAARVVLDELRAQRPQV